MSHSISADRTAGALKRVAAWVTLALAASTSGCEPQGSAARVAREAPSPYFRVVASDVDDGVHAGDGAIRIELDRPVDAASTAGRSVRVERAGGRRVRRLRVRAAGTSLFVVPAPGHELPTGEDLVLRIEGGGSPRALRARDGSVLSTTRRIPVRALRRRRADLEGPSLLLSLPEAGATDAAPASHVLLRFDEPLSRASLRSGEAIIVRVDRREVPARLRLSPDLTRVVVRPRWHLPPGVEVTVDVLPSLLDLAGNPADPVTVRFRTEATRLRELREDFVTTEMVDAAATTGGWAEPEMPGFLTARAGRVRRSAGEVASGALPAAERVRFQVILPPVDHGGGLASALRLRLRGARPGDPVHAHEVAVGPTSLVRADPTFRGNRSASLLTEALGAAPGALATIEADEDGLPYVDLAFDLPVPVSAGEHVLVDATVSLPPGARIAAGPDVEALALVEGAGVGSLLPSAELLVSGGAPQARSLWWDSGAERPGWQAASFGPAAPDGDVVVEFQTAAATGDGHPDLDRVSDWGPDLRELPALRFARFRVTFARLGARGNAPRIDWVVLPFQE